MRSEKENTAVPPLKVAYLGPIASFSHQAASAVFPGTNANLTPLPTFTSIFTALQQTSPPKSTINGDTKVNDLDQSDFDYAILPNENSTNGSVVQVLDLLAQCSTTYPDLEIIAEHYLPVHHYLYTTRSNQDRSPDTPTPAPNLNSPSSYDLDLTSIKTLYSHPQVWTQCSRFLLAHVPHAERIDVSSTSYAATLISNLPPSNDSDSSDSNSSAAICSQLAGTLSDLHLLAPNIEDEPDSNTTRFFILRNRRRNTSHPMLSFLSPKIIFPTPSPNQAVTRGAEQLNIKSLVLFTITHTRPGALSSALAIFATHGLNLTRIDTRPSRGQGSWHYVFFVECEERRGPVGVKRREGSGETKGETKGEGEEKGEEESKGEWKWEGEAGWRWKREGDLQWEGNWEGGKWEGGKWAEGRWEGRGVKKWEEGEGRLGGAMRKLGEVTESVVCLGSWVDMLQFSGKDEKAVQDVKQEEQASIGKLE